MEIAAITGEAPYQYWPEEVRAAAYFGLASRLCNAEDPDAPNYLVDLDEQGKEIPIRLDLIRNRPIPIK